MFEVCLDGPAHQHHFVFWELEAQVLLASLSVMLSLFKVEPGLVIDSLVLSGYC